MNLETQSLQRLRADVISTQNNLQQFSDLLDATFPVFQGGHFFDDFPIWDSRFDISSVFRLGVFEGQKLVSAAAVRLAQIKLPKGGLASVAVIGGVATYPEWRRQGLASQLVHLALQWAREHGACLALLWGGEHSLYYKLGFTHCGRQVRLSLERVFNHVSSQETSSEIPVHSGWNSQLFDLIRKRKDGFVLGERDRPWFEAHKNVQWFYTGTVDSPQAYVALGRGIDLNNLIHEWGGDLPQLIQIFKVIKNNFKEISVIGSPEHFQSLGIVLSRNDIEFLCMAKVLDPVKLFSTFFPAFPALISTRGIQLQVSVGVHTLPWMTEQQLVTEVFGPKRVESNDSLPLVPLWVWGLDAA